MGVIMNRLFVSIFFCLVLITGVAGSQSAQVNVNVQDKIEAIYRSCRVSNQVDLVEFEAKMLSLINESSPEKEDTGLIYKTIAEEFSRDVARYASNVVEYAQLAISNNIDVLDGSRMYLNIADARKAISSNSGKDENVRTIQAVPILKGLLLALTNLKTTKLQAPPAVSKYDIDPETKHSTAIRSAHFQQNKARDQVVRQNQLLMLCVLMSDRIVQLYGADYANDPSFICAVREVTSIPAEKELIIRQIRFLSANGLSILGMGR